MATSTELIPTLIYVTKNTKDTLTSMLWINVIEVFGIETVSFHKNIDNEHLF